MRTRRQPPRQEEAMRKASRISTAVSRDSRALQVAPFVAKPRPVPMVRTDIRGRIETSLIQMKKA
jgi:hypothetical protein